MAKRPPDTTSPLRPRPPGQHAGLVQDSVVKARRSAGCVCLSRSFADRHLDLAKGAERADFLPPSPGHLFASQGQPAPIFIDTEQSAQRRSAPHLPHVRVVNPSDGRSVSATYTVPIVAHPSAECRTANLLADRTPDIAVTQVGRVSPTAPPSRQPRSDPSGASQPILPRDLPVMPLRETTPPLASGAQTESLATPVPDRLAFFSQRSVLRAKPCPRYPRLRPSGSRACRIRKRPPKRSDRLRSDVFEPANHPASARSQHDWHCEPGRLSRLRPGPGRVRAPGWQSSSCQRTWWLDFGRLRADRRRTSLVRSQRPESSTDAQQRAIASG